MVYSAPAEAPSAAGRRSASGAPLFSAGSVICRVRHCQPLQYPLSTTIHASSIRLCGGAVRRWSDPLLYGAVHRGRRLLLHPMRDVREVPNRQVLHVLSRVERELFSERGVALAPNEERRDGDLRKAARADARKP